MEIFVFDKTDSPLDLVNSRFIHSYTTVMWIERYRDPGEFKITGPINSGLKEQLPLNSLISHVNTYELMVVENIRIVENVDADPTIEISGRSLDAWLENRVVGMSQHTSEDHRFIEDVVLDSETTPYQAAALVNMYTNGYYGANSEDHTEGIFAAVDDGEMSIPPIGPRVMKRGNLHERLIELLKIDDFGIRTIRKNDFSFEMASIRSYFLIHKGMRRVSSVIFSSKKGIINSSEYLWTNKTTKNTALVTGKWIEVEVYGSGDIGFDRRTMYIEATDIDGSYSEAPVIATPEYDAVIEQLTIRGQTALAGQNELFLSRCDISNESPYRFRIHYQIGDTVLVQTGFGGSFEMRVIEFTEIEDENGDSGHPTLAGI